MKKLKKFLLTIGVITLVFYSNLLFSQSTNQKGNCKVLMPEISGKYEGGCKKGLANGLGKAIGKDTYVGSFKKGLPNGIGIYTWTKTGAVYDGNWKKGFRKGKGKYTITINGKDSITQGYWDKNKYIGKNKVTKRYSVIFKRGISNLYFFKNGDGNQVIIEVDEIQSPTNLLMQGSSGSQFSYAYTGFQNITFPFKGRITYDIKNKLSATSHYCALEFEIFEPGDWTIKIRN